MSFVSQRILLLTDLGPGQDTAASRVLAAARRWGAGVCVLYPIRRDACRRELDHLPAHHIEAEMARWIAARQIQAPLPRLVALAGPPIRAAAEQAARDGADLIAAAPSIPAGPGLLAPPTLVTLVTRVGRPLLVVAGPGDAIDDTVARVPVTRVTANDFTTDCLILPEGGGPWNTHH